VIGPTPRSLKLSRRANTRGKNRLAFSSRLSQDGAASYLSCDFSCDFDRYASPLLTRGGLSLFGHLGSPRLRAGLRAARMVAQKFSQSKEGER
jgi:hypothetical protein